MDAAYVDSIRKSAFLAVIDPDYSAWIRGICRWFSMKFNTPLNEVEGYTVEYLLQHYFEVMYSDLDDEGKAQQRQWLLETQAERLQRIAKEEAEEDDFYKEAQKELKESMTLEKATEQHKQVNSTQNLKFKETPPEPIPVDLPEIKINFVDSEEFEENMDYDPIPSK